MNPRLEILVEERSMEVFLRGLLPRILPRGFEVDTNCFIISHEGKSDLQKRLPKRVKAYRSYPDKVVLLVIQDQDSSDCIILKNKLLALVDKNNPALIRLIRIACRELENWFLGDLAGVESIYPSSRAARKINKAKFRNVDALNGSDEMKKLSSEFSKIACARQMGHTIDPILNTSNSFRQFTSGLSRLLKEHGLG